MILGLLKDKGLETRTALLPETVKKFRDLKVDVWVEKEAGISAFATDEAYVESGAQIKTREELFEKADVLLQIQSPLEDDLQSIKDKQVWVSAFNPLWNKDITQSFLSKGLTSFSLDLIPRTTRAQSMDILSSMATISGYQAVLDAAFNLPTFFPMFMTAAGTIRPATVLILGAGVAGLQAIASSRKLGAQVHVFDVRSAVKEEVLSLGAKFVEVEGATEDAQAGGYAVEQSEEFKKKQKEAIHNVAVKSDVIICTAQIPGKQAPLLIDKTTVEAMKAGSVIVDLAASTGGNCELSKDNETILHNNVKIIGESNYPAKMPVDGSRMFGQNVFNFLKLMITEEGELNLNFEDEIVKGTCITHQNEVYNERVKLMLEQK